MKRILYIGYLKEQSDWGFFATQNILGLEKAGYDVVCRSIDFSTKGRVDKRIEHLYNKDIGGQPFDVTFQHIFPNHMVKSDDFGKCVAITPHPDLPHSTWNDGLDLMDEVYPVEEVQCFDPDTYKQNYSGISVPSMDRGFKFYTIASQKSLPSILKCFHTEFATDESVHLIIQSENTGRTDWNSLITKVKETIGIMPLESYRKDMVVEGYDSPISRYQLHWYCQCLLSEGKNEFDRNDMESVFLGNVCIKPSLTPEIKYHSDIDGKHVWSKQSVSVASVKVRKQSQKSALFADRNNAFEFDIAVDEQELSKAMRAQFESWKVNPISYRQPRIGIEFAEELAEKSINTLKSIIG